MSKIEWYIYKITSPTGKVYIGQTRHIVNRKNRYKNGHCKEQPKIYRSLLKYGWDAHRFEVIEICKVGEKKNVNNREIHWIAFYNSMKDGLNCIPGGHLSSGRKGKKNSDEHIKKRVEKIKGKPLGEEHRKNIAKAQKGNQYGKGYKFTEEQKKARATNPNILGRTPWNKGLKFQKENYRTTRIPIIDNLN